MIRSGGVFYHLRALRFENALWSGHQSSVASFLDAWNPKSKDLTLIGPSAGYSLPTVFLKRFETVYAYEPDPWARMIFERIHGVRPVWKKSGFRFLGADPIEQLPKDGSAVLFCNVLGQIEIPSTHRLKKSLETHLKDREWASFHDALSGYEIDFDLEDARPEKALLPKMKEWIYVRSPRSGSIEVNAHHAPDLFEGTSGNYRYWQWRITPRQTHLIEGVFRGA
ncbi:MAG: hypothetical protein KGP28_01010 [Bdellovibrionales bacterium]|nr:hypothetical protein [Bdellovibrionales bacterium]